MRIRTNERILTMQDVLMLINSIINRQTGEYTVKEIAETAKRYLAGSSVQVSDIELMQIIKCNLDVSLRYHLAEYRNGKYRTII